MLVEISREIISQTVAATIVLPNIWLVICSLICRFHHDKVWDRGNREIVDKGRTRWGVNGTNKRLITFVTASDRDGR
jgi:hypothetical protein